MLQKSKHFNERWREEIHGKPPTISKLNAMISESVLLQRFRRVTSTNGRPMIIMAIYYHDVLGIHFKVDESRSMVVTVYTKKTLRNPKRNKKWIQ